MVQGKVRKEFYFDENPKGAAMKRFLTWNLIALGLIGCKITEPEDNGTAELSSSAAVSELSSAADAYSSGNGIPIFGISSALASSSSLLDYSSSSSAALAPSSQASSSSASLSSAALSSAMLSAVASSSSAMTPTSSSSSSSSLASSSSLTASSSSATNLVVGRKVVAGNFSLPSLLWDSTEVTQGEFFALLNERPWTSAVSSLGGNSNLVGSDRPATMNYFQAVRLANARSKAEGLDTVYSWNSQGSGSESWMLLGLVRNPSAKGYRLPTAAEWEFAYGAEANYSFYWTNKSWVRGEYPLNAADSAEIGEYAVYDFNSRLLGSSSSAYGWHAVATKKPNRYGLYDMAGNVCEYVEMEGDLYAYSANIHCKGSDWGSPYMGLTNSSGSGTILTASAFWGLRLVRPLL